MKIAASVLIHLNKNRLETSDVTSFPTVFQDDKWMIMKGCVQWNPVYK